MQIDTQGLTYYILLLIFIQPSEGVLCVSVGPSSLVLLLCGGASVRPSLCAAYSWNDLRHLNGARSVLNRRGQLFLVYA